MATSATRETPTHKCTTLEERNRLALQNMPLVKYALARMALYCPNHISRDDLATCGVIGLLKAAKEYDPRNRTRFSTFAVPRIRGAILDELRSNDWVPRSVKRKLKTLERSRARLAQRFDGAVSDKQIAKAMNLSRRQLHKVLALSTPVNVVSLDNLPAQTDDGDQVPLADVLRNDRTADPLTLVSSEEDRHRLGQAILELQDPDRLVITLHYYKGMMLKDIARLLKLSKSRVSQIHKAALQRLRRKLATLEPAESP
mgnify:CR=1 FL=1